jgi:hypothetical protein
MQNNPVHRSELARIIALCSLSLRNHQGDTENTENGQGRRQEPGDRKRVILRRDDGRGPLPSPCLVVLRVLRVSVVKQPLPTYRPLFVSASILRAIFSRCA